MAVTNLTSRRDAGFQEIMRVIKGRVLRNACGSTLASEFAQNRDITDHSKRVIARCPQSARDRHLAREELERP